MRNPFQTPFGAVFQNEVLLNSRRIAPYALIILFVAHALLWWFKGPAVRLGWATNSDFYIVRNLLGFSFLLGLPIFNSVIMGDPVIRDFRQGIDPLIFSKPVNRAQYLLGKFLGSFFVLVCCQAAFPLTLLVLQAFRTSQMIVQPVRVFPYFKHFFFFVVISHLVLAAFYFTVGTLTRSAKIVYGLAVSFYPLYISFGLVVLRSLPLPWRALLDPMLLGSSLRGNGFLHSAEFLNRYVVPYTAEMFANRVLAILVTGLLLAILYARFTISERAVKVEHFSRLNLLTTTDRVYFDADSFAESSRLQPVDQVQIPDEHENPMVPIALPEVARANEGLRVSVQKLITALGVELMLLRAERSLIVVLPLAVLLSTLDVVFFKVVPEVSFAAVYATKTAQALSLFLVGITVFYTGEAMHRDRELRMEPLLWATPVTNSVLLLSKFCATLLLTLSLIVLVGLTAVVAQILKGETPIEISSYLITYAVILVPSAIFLAGVSVALNILLRDKYLAYAASIGAAAGLFYLYGQGYLHWLYNPLLYRLWTYADITGAGSNQGTILLHRLYCMAIAVTLLSLAHLCCRRKSAKGLLVDSRLSGTGWSILLALMSLTTAIITGRVISSLP